MALSLLFPSFFPYLYTAIEIGFTRQRIYHEESWGEINTIINISRVSEQNIFILVESSTHLSEFGQRATLDRDFMIGYNGRFVYLNVWHGASYIYFTYRILGDNVPENQEVFQVSVTSAINSPPFGCSVTNGCYQQIEIVIIDDDGEL